MRRAGIALDILGWRLFLLDWRSLSHTGSPLDGGRQREGTMPRALGITLALVIILAGSQMARGAKPEKVDFGVGSAPGGSVYIQVDLAKALGYFADEGLDLNLQHFKGGAVAGAALVGGSTEVSANAIDHVIKAKQQGKELRFIVSFTHLPGTPLIVNTKYRDEIKSPKDLRGRPVGVAAPGSATDLLTRYLMVKEGVRPEEMIPWRSGPR
jgi:NitT/TauT family transport system substrate-binding protein